MSKRDGVDWYTPRKTKKLIEMGVLRVDNLAPMTNGNSGKYWSNLSAFQAKRRRSALLVLSEYLKGKKTREIGESMDPPVTHQRVVQIIQLAIRTAIENGWMKVL